MKELKEKAKALEPLVRVGKNGLTSKMMDEIKRQLRKKRMIKIKFLKSSLGKDDRKKLKDEVIIATKAKLIDQVGNVIVIKK